MSAVICRSRGGLSANEKKEKFASNDNFYSLLSVLSIHTFYTAMASEIRESLWESIKAKPLVAIGRFMFFSLLMIQSGFLAAYPATYQDRDTAALFLLCIPVLVYWIYCLCTEASLLRMFFTWGLYLVVFLIPMIATIFAVAGDELDKTKFLGPNTLKVILCLTPVLFLFLPNTASGLSESDHYRQLAFRLTIQVTIDLFDTVEMLDIVLDENENSHGIPKWFGRLMVAVACFSFLLSLLQMAENKLVDGKVEQWKCLAKFRNVVQMVFVNLVFMVIRLVIFFKYKKEESIFIAKNGIAIYFSALELYSILRSQRNQADQA